MAERKMAGHSHALLQAVACPTHHTGPIWIPFHTHIPAVSFMSTAPKRVPKEAQRMEEKCVCAKREWESRLLLLAFLSSLFIINETK